MRPKYLRLAEILKRLHTAPACATDREVLSLVADVMNTVEDELSGLPYDPVDATMLRLSERMYPPLDDSEIPSMLPDVRCYRTLGHEVLVSATGALLIRRRNGVELSKPGTDGKEIEP